MPVALETDQRNSQLAERIEAVINRISPVSDEEIAAAVNLLNSLVPEAAKVQYETRHHPLGRRLHFSDHRALISPGIGPILSAAYHPVERIGWQSDFRGIPEDFTLPVFALILLERTEGGPVRVPTPHGMLPNIALTTDGFLIRFRSSYFFNRQGQGIRYDAMDFTNRLDLPPERPSAKELYNPELRIAQRIPLGSDTVLRGRMRLTPLTEDDLRFVELIMRNIELQKPQ